MVFSESLNKEHTNYDLNIADFAAGVYVVKVKYNSGVAVQKRLMIYKSRIQIDGV